MAAETKSLPEARAHSYVRFSLAQRIEHFFMLLSFGTLGLTGLPQKYATHPVSEAMVAALGGIEVLRYIHHAAAIIMMLGTIYHIIIVGYKIFVLRLRMTMLPSLQDGMDAIGALLYNIGLRKHRPQMGRYTFEEKAEYWAFVWGAVVMGFTGFLMWNPILSTSLFPGELVPAAKAAHGGEAVLAVLAIIVWHMYGVHLKHFNKAMWTGKMTEEEMLHEHPLELADIKAGTAERPVNPADLRKRQLIYVPVASVLTVVMLAGVLGFVNSEQTAVETIPPQPQAVEAFVPQTPTPFPMPLPTVETWEGSISALLQTRCSICHGPAARGGLKLATYADLMKGSANGPVILPGNSAGSKLIAIQSAGGHFGQLTPDEIAQLIAWIDAGALEK